MISICISTKDRVEALKKLVESIKKYTTDYEIIVVDDVSSDETPQYVRSEKIIYKRNEDSIPVANAWNQAAEMAGGKYLVFLNDDMEVTEGWVEAQIAMYETFPLVGSLAFKVYDDQGNVQSRGHSFNGLVPYLPEEEAIEVDYSDHPFISKKKFDKVGGFTAHGQLYYEDVDFGLKLQSSGLKNYYNLNAILIHNTLGLRTGTDEDKKKRQHNEKVIQLKSKESFYKSWSDYLLFKKNEKG